MKQLLIGVLLLIVLGIGGLVYRNAVEHPNQPIACPADAKLCPDGTSVSRIGLGCEFPACPPPNVTLSDIGIVYAVPDGFAATEVPDASSVVAYAEPIASSTDTNRIVIRRYAVDASSTPLSVIQQTAISGTSGQPVGVTAYSSSVINGTRFTTVSIERFEGVIDTAYYLARGSDVLRFDAIDAGVADWTDPNLDLSILPAHAALAKLLAGLELQ